jgi:hypothetical protein
LILFDKPEQYLEKVLHQGTWEFNESRYIIEETSAKVEGEMMLEWNLKPKKQGRMTEELKVRHRMMREGSILKMY